MPRPVQVRVGRGGAPAAVGALEVEQVREDWVVEDRWWTGSRLRRRYFEVVLASGRDIVVFHDMVGRGWFEQRA